MSNFDQPPAYFEGIGSIPLEKPRLSAKMEKRNRPLLRVFHRTTSAKRDNLGEIRSINGTSFKERHLQRLLLPGNQ